jgi:uncharacterized membrane protein
LGKKKSKKKTGSRDKRPSRLMTGRPPLLRRQDKRNTLRPMRLPTALVVSSSLMRWVWVHFWLLIITVLFGALQTSLQGGAVLPGWPGSFRSPWIFCPLSLWFGHWDVFVAQWHRLLGYLLAGAMAVILFRLFRIPRKAPFLRSLSILLLLALVMVAISGGLRIRWNDRFMANAHAIVSLFYLLGSVLLMEKMRILAPEDSRHVRRIETPEGRRWLRRNRRMLHLAGFGLLLSCFQVFAGVQMRHFLLESSTEWVMVWVWSHVVGAILLGVVMVLTAWRLAKLRSFADRHLRHRGQWLWGLFGLQAVLGTTTWIVNFNWPLWFYQRVYPLIYTIKENGFFQVWTTAVHVVVGYLIVAVLLSIVLRLRRRSRVALSVSR